MSEKFEQFETILAKAKDDFVKFYEKGQAAAGTRVRKALQELSVLCKTTRKEITDIKAARKDSTAE